MRMMLTAALVLAALAAGCSQPGADKGAGGSACAGGAAALAVTGLCPEAALQSIAAERLAGAPALEGPAAACSWTVQETAIGDGSEAVLYRAMTCNGVTTAFEFSGGAHSAALNYAASALGHAAGEEAVRLFVSEPENPTQPLQTLIAALPPAERAKCEAHPAGIAGWPSDALVIGYNAQATRALSTSEPNAVCGAFGLNEDEMKFWLVRDGYAFFFSLGQDALDFDPNSVTVFRRGETGAWAPAS